MCANYESAVRDERFLQRMSPSSPLGYIREAEVYIQQGKPQRVIDVCKQALGLVDNKDAHYATLQRIREDAEQRQNIRIDFISKLAFDIVTTSLIPLIMPRCALEAWEPQPKLNVSKRWHDRIAQSSGGLKFNIDSDYDDGCPQVARLAQYTKTLQIGIYSTETWVCDLLLENNFCSLRELCIYQYWNREDDQFLSALKSISTTLTDLYISLQPSH
ncbi:predicted protein [Lichtheimia corymbifera JMRC:FSU:9682]|uniref:Uncharacterized protein n=1 Tax=Lichtheimia corymbifera JMRC:FSU:9682 TaxID=1263082 RepID=A0A068SFY8_9FUNG|nr:predicted protein [Lichtheimia corymbifera JMRC:FSU:9682]